jgi:hypothetical protein
MLFTRTLDDEESDHPCRTSGAGGQRGSVSEDHADPEGAAAVLSGVKNILAGISGGASLLSSGLSIISGSSTASEMDSSLIQSSVETVGDDTVDPLMGQPLRIHICDEERAAMEAEDKAKSAAYAAVEVKIKTQKQL